MPRRAVTRATSSSLVPPSAPPSPPPSLSDDAYHANLFTLRTSWKWAAFEQFYFTFAPVFAMNEVPVSEIEDDLARSTRLQLPRVMQRLLYALTQDRKISLDNWQSALRKQYARRDPTANPIGFEPKKSTAKFILEPINIKDEPIITPADTPAAATSVPPEGSAEPPEPPAQSEDGEPIHTEDATTTNGQEELKDWFELPMLTKLDCLYLLTEWQFQNPNRIRTIMKDDDETAQWRIQPIGYDSKSNAYWFIGADRLWIQREPYKPNSLKRKRASTAPNARKPPVNRNRKSGGKRRRVQVPESSESELDSPAAGPAPPKGRAGTRAAKTKANKQLDVQAKALAEFQRQNSSRKSRAAKRQQTDDDEIEFGSSPRKSVGTRLSKRLRGAVEEEEWQQIPEEWLGDETQGVKAGKNGAGKLKAPEKEQLTKGSKAKTGLESDVGSISDLTDLSSEDEADNDDEKVEKVEEEEGREEVENAEESVKEEPEPEEPQEEPPTGEFIEWEMICSTFEEWEHISQRFEKATHYAEKSLHKLLSKHIVPAVLEDMQAEMERQRQIKLEEERKRRIIEETLMPRKRSSRIAVKESQKEEARLAALRETDEVERMSRSKRLAMRQKRDEEERLKKEQAQEQRQQERDRAAKNAGKSNGNGNLPVDDSRETSTSSSRIATGSQIGGNWELDCEICYRQGFNQDDRGPLACCCSCNKWQHIQCHDAADRMIGRPPRNWEVEEFTCANCRAKPVAVPLSQPLHDPHQHPQNYAKSKINLRWDHGRSSPKIPPGPMSIPPPIDPRLNRMRPADIPILPPPMNGSYHQPMNGTPRVNVMQPASAASYSNISFSHYQPQHRGFSPNSHQGIPQQGHILPHPSLPQPSHPPPAQMYAPYNGGIPDPQAFVPGFNDVYDQVPVMPTLQNGSWDAPHDYAHQPANGYPAPQGYTMPPPQDPRVYHQQQPPIHEQEWGYGAPNGAANHLGMNGSGSMDFRM